MSKEIAAAFGGDNLPAQFNAQALMQSTAALPQTSDKPFLTFKDGEWTFGADAAEIEEGSLWAVNPHSFQFGLIEWFNSSAGAEILVPAGTPYNANDLALQFDPEDPDHRIAPQIAADLLCVSGDDEGLEVQFKTSTRGGVDALNKIAQAVAKQAAENPDEIVAVVTLNHSSYMHKKYKRKTYVPVVEIKTFDDMALSVSKQLDEAAPEEAPAKEAAPAGNSRRKRRAR